MKHKLLILAGVLAVVAVLGGFYAKPVAAEIRGLLVQDVDQPARAPFQTVVNVTLANAPVPVAIPKGYRLVIDYICAHGTAADTSGNPTIQAGFDIHSTLAGGTEVVHTISAQQSTIVSNQFFGSWPVTIYADSLSVGLIYSGGDPLPNGYVDFYVAISGHLIAVR